MLGLQPTLQGVEAVNTLLEATPESPSYMIGMNENKISRISLMDAVKMVLLAVLVFFWSILSYLVADS